MFTGKEKTAEVALTTRQSMSQDTRNLINCSLTNPREKGKKYFQTIDGETLMNQPLKELFPLIPLDGIDDEWKY